MLEGNRAVAERAANHLATGVDAGMMRVPGLGFLQQFLVTPMFTAVGFEDWAAAMTLPQPDVDLPYPTAVWHWARATALARTGKTAEAAAESVRLHELAADPALAELSLGTTTAASLVAIAARLATAEIALAEGDRTVGLAAFADAAALEDVLTYDEPPTWPLPVRHRWGAALLAAGRPADAERVFREDLVHFPDNGRTLWGLTESLKAQGKSAEAADAGRRFEQAWADADVTLGGD